MANNRVEIIGAIVLVLALLLISQIHTGHSSSFDRPKCYVVGDDTSGC